ncbi:hypothetical protein GQ43DRAFT_218957 [Delitschia confertaspora ATCC 74209]|uniref:RNase MRP protein 1 RNA binding domain-containing protein n=1 Tax=Delitschia confertaspora ATCC 74209 TaxID=1513339 RepID=A0A9P4MUM7_9PLEO|nr:hypothetical protein GQ43DRAFT_218957 [Delitschia confertaspora ATCC 74209]
MATFKSAKSVQAGDEGAVSPKASTPAPKATAKALLTINYADKQAMTDIHELLTRLYVRNRNQHRHSHWFRSLGMFRKQLGLLLAEMEDKKKGNVAETLEKRLQFWDTQCIHDWYLTFTQLVAAGQFAMIGLVLMAAIARVCKISGITDLYEEIGSNHMKVVLLTVDDGTLLEEFGDLVAADGEEDSGEVIERE